MNAMGFNVRQAAQLSSARSASGKANGMLDDILRVYPENRAMSGTVDED
jgi:hypothetical protein